MHAPASSPTREHALLAAAGDGDEGAFAELVERMRPGLFAHCYRMLGSAHDAEESLQDTLLRAWRSAAKFEGRSSASTWLYAIATNSCLTLLDRRRRRALPVDYRPAADPHGGPGDPLEDAYWIEPFPDSAIEQVADHAGPEARYDERESVELAFIAAMQHLTASQRAVLILCDVLSFSAREAAETLDTTIASVTSSLQRARRATDERLPERSQQETLRALGDRRLGELVQAYTDAWQREDIDAVVSMLTDDATFAMPPLQSWFRGRDAIAVFLRGSPLSGRWRWRPLRASVNGQEALAYYGWDDAAKRYIPFALNVLTLRGDAISDVTAFLTRSGAGVEPDDMDRLLETPPDPARLHSAFGRVGLPLHLD
jgi:RNA polymerase sigma-70 factor (ECF subfamily)